MILLLLACASPPPPDAEPFAGALVALDADHDGVVSLAEYPQHPVGGAEAAQVDRDGNGRISLVEVRDEVFAVNPASFDKMAWAHGNGGGRTATGDKPPPGPLAEALRFLRDLAATRSPGAVLPTDEQIAAVALEGMPGEAGVEVARILSAAGAPPPAALLAASADPPGAPPGDPGPQRSGARPPLRNDGPGGPTAVRNPAKEAPTGGKRPKRGSAPGGPPPATPGG